MDQVRIFYKCNNCIKETLLARVGGLGWQIGYNLFRERGRFYTFKSFGARDKTYLMLFRVWQNALMDQVPT